MRDIERESGVDTREENSSLLEWRMPRQPHHQSVKVGVYSRGLVAMRRVTNRSFLRSAYYFFPVLSATLER